MLQNKKVHHRVKPDSNADDPKEGTQKFQAKVDATKKPAERKMEKGDFNYSLVQKVGCCCCCV